MRRMLAAVPVLAMVLAGCAAEPPPPPPVASAPPTSAAPVAPTVESTAGNWAGRIGIPGQPLDIGIKMTAENGALKGELEIPSQEIKAMPLAEIKLDGRNLSFKLPQMPGDAQFRGTFEADGKSIPGAFTQQGQSYPLVLHPGPVAGRPQDPRPPVPYRSEEVKYRGQDIDITGTLTAPNGPGPYAAIVLVSGSGAQDRDHAQFGHKPFLVLADMFTRAGYAVLRVDDRGVGGTGGDTATANYDTLTADLVGGVDYLRNRPEVDPARIGLVGHGEGGYLVPLAAQKTVIAFAMLLAAPAVVGEEVLVEQNRLLLEAAGAPQETIEAQIAYIREIARLLREENYRDAQVLTFQQLAAQASGLPPEQQPSPEELEAQVLGSINPAYRAFVVHDPAPSLHALGVPTLAIYAGADIQVPAAQSELAMKALLSGKADTHVETFPRLNHMLQPAETGSPDEYGTIETTIDQHTVDYLRTWLTQRFPT